MKPKISDVAKRAGVSPTTVSRVLNNRGYISEETKTRVHQAMKDINYFPNDVARSLFNKRTNVIGLIFPTVANPFFGELTFYIENICTKLGYKVLLCNSLNRVDEEEKYVEMLMRNQVDGIIVGTHNRGIINYHKEHLAVVAIDRNLSETTPVVSSDNYEGGKLATELLLKKGCHHIVHLNGPAELETPARFRRKAYEDVMRQSGKEPITYEIPATFDRRSQQGIIEQLFDEQVNVDGIFASDDVIAASVLREAKRRGRDVPSDLKVVGYDGTEVTQTLLPELTTIKQPVEQIAQQSVELLLQAIEGKFGELPLETKLPVQLLEGSTT
ncbi:LacI family DNA-binding transcriptional regulator [Priestia flexa]|uniref:LacI family DNA-binding transcriptional regulator n=1 Tax=Priestia flexa TaxID=86664 RepID=UPI001A8C38B1|nr:LacI family DNA-binding transcriptional regulator [Priestia flexa]MBN8435393.1 LacI family DNA-binding transcriptional regulator [Priestia flexa]MCA0968030.1 LacI family DNA-binding transcriptional regulator [Priestia flexa]